MSETFPHKSSQNPGEKYDQAAVKASELTIDGTSRLVNEESSTDVVDGREVRREAREAANLRKELKKAEQQRKADLATAAFRAKPEFNMAAAGLKSHQPADKKATHPGKFAESIENWRKNVAHWGDIGKKTALIGGGLVLVGGVIATWNLFIELLKLGWDVTVKQGLMQEAGIGGGKR